MALATINTESFTEVINYHACDNVATRDCAVALSDFVAFTNQTNMTDYDILAISLGLVGCLATRKRMISRRVQKRPDMEQFHLSGTAFVKEDRETGKVAQKPCYASAVLAMGLCLSVTSRCSTETGERIELVFGM